MTDLSAQFRQALAELELVSHAPVQGYDFAPTEGAHRARWRTSSASPPVAHAGSHQAKGGDTKVPKGVDGEFKPRRPSAPRCDGDAQSEKAWDEYEEELAAWAACYQRRTVSYYRERLRSRGPSDWLLADIRRTVDAWRRAPIPTGQEPEYGSPQWKRYVAESPLGGGDLARKFNCSREYIRQIRDAYRAA